MLPASAVLTGEEAHAADPSSAGRGEGEERQAALAFGRGFTALGGAGDEIVLEPDGNRGDLEGTAAIDHDEGAVVVVPTADHLVTGEPEVVARPGGQDVAVTRVHDHVRGVAWSTLRKVGLRIRTGVAVEIGLRVAAGIGNAEIAVEVGVAVGFSRLGGSQPLASHGTRGVRPST